MKSPGNCGVPGARPALSVNQVQAAEAAQPVVELRVHIGQRLVAEIAHLDVVDLQVLRLAPQIGALVERVADGGIRVHGDRLERWQIDRLDRHGPEVGRRGIEDERRRR